MMQFAHFMESGAISKDETTGYYTVDFEKMKKDIEVIAGEYITIEGDGDIQKATKLGYRSPNLTERSGSYRRS